MTVNIEKYKEYFDQIVIKIIDWSSSPEFYAQFGLIMLAIIFSYTASVFL